MQNPQRLAAGDTMGYTLRELLHGRALTTQKSLALPGATSSAQNHGGGGAERGEGGDTDWTSSGGNGAISASSIQYNASSVEGADGTLGGGGAEDRGECRKVT